MSSVKNPAMTVLQWVEEFQRVNQCMPRAESIVAQLEMAIQQQEGFLGNLQQEAFQDGYNSGAHAAATDILG